MVEQITFRQTRDEGHLREILALQKSNLERSVSEEEISSEGYVTVDHDFELLRELAEAQGHTVALSNDKVVGYALIMMPEFRSRIPVLTSMFEMLEGCLWQGKSLIQVGFHVMGQVCISRAFRGQGLFRGLYDHQRFALKDVSQVIITEVAERNQRSLSAHLGIGFESLHEFRDENEQWHIIGLAT